MGVAGYDKVKTRVIEGKKNVYIKNQREIKNMLKVSVK